MNNQRIYKFWISLLIVLLFLVALPPGIVSADQTGRIGLMLDDEIIQEIPAESSVKLSFYQIGEIDTAGGNDWKMRDGFAEYGVLEAKTTSEMVKIAAKLSEDISGKNIAADTVTFSGGRAVLSELPLGIYLGVLQEGPEGLSLDPFILSLPSMDQAEENLYDYAVTMKALYTSPSAMELSTEKDSDEEEEDGDDDDNDNDSKSGTNRKTKTTRTGDDNRIRFYLVLMATAVLGSMILLMRKKADSALEIDHPEESVKKNTKRRRGGCHEES